MAVIPPTELEADQTIVCGAANLADLEGLLDQGFS
jgi:hypothetical protein